MVLPFRALFDLWHFNLYRKLFITLVLPVYGNRVLLISY